MCVVHLQEECQAFQIKGSAKSKIMFIEGGDALKSDVESLAVRPQPPLDEEGNWVLKEAVSLFSIFIQVSKDIVPLSVQSVYVCIYILKDW